MLGMIVRLSFEILLISTLDVQEAVPTKPYFSNIILGF